MSKPWREPYVGLEWDHPARKHYREIHDGVDPWFMGSEAYRLISQICLCGLACVCLGGLFLTSIPTVVFMAAVALSLFGLVLALYTRNDEFADSIREVEGLLRLPNGERFATTEWAVLRDLARIEMKTRARLWREFTQQFQDHDPLHYQWDDAEKMRQNIRRCHQLFASLGLVPVVPLENGPWPVPPRVVAE